MLQKLVGNPKNKIEEIKLGEVYELFIFKIIVCITLLSPRVM